MNEYTIAMFMLFVNIYISILCVILDNAKNRLVISQRGVWVSYGFALAEVISLLAMKQLQNKEAIKYLTNPTKFAQR